MACFETTKKDSKWDFPFRRLKKIRSLSLSLSLSLHIYRFLYVYVMPPINHHKTKCGFFAESSESSKQNHWILMLNGLFFTLSFFLFLLSYVELKFKNTEIKLAFYLKLLFGVVKYLFLKIHLRNICKHISWKNWMINLLQSITSLH